MAESRFDMHALFPDLDEFEDQPEAAAAGELKILDMALYPEEDGQRVVVGVAITRTDRQPDLEIAILAPDGRLVAETRIIESRSTRQAVTLHLRPPDPALTYTVRAGLLIEGELVDARQAALTWPQ